MRIKEDININLNAFLNICKSHKVKYLYAFGSAVSENFNSEKSDIDLVVELDILDPIEHGENLIKLWDELEDFFDRKVDLLTNDSIRNPILKKNIDKTKILIYDGTGQEIFI